MLGSTDATVAVVADDLTGAADCAAQFAEEGWTARLLLDGQARTDRQATALALVTDARALDGEAARIATARAVGASCGAGHERLFLKIDSTMRGPVAEQIAGALDAWSQRHPGAGAVVCPPTRRWAARWPADESSSTGARPRRPPSGAIPSRPA